MKRALAILFFSLLIFNIIGMWVYFQLAKKATQFHAIQMISELKSPKELQTLTFTTAQLSQLEWHKEGREFRHLGEMYDIVKSVSKGNQTIYYCYQDKKESKLMERYHHWVKSIFGSDNSQSDFFKSFHYQLDYIPSLVTTQITNLNSKLWNFRALFNYQTYGSQIVLNKLSPPPKIALVLEFFI